MSGFLSLLFGFEEGFKNSPECYLQGPAGMKGRTGTAGAAGAPGVPGLVTSVSDPFVVEDGNLSLDPTQGVDLSFINVPNQPFFYGQAGLVEVPKPTNNDNERVMTITNNNTLDANFALVGVVGTFGDYGVGVKVVAKGRYLVTARHHVPELNGSGGYVTIKAQVTNQPDRFSSMIIESSGAPEDIGVSYILTFTAELNPGDEIVISAINDTRKKRNIDMPEFTIYKLG